MKTLLSKLTLLFVVVALAFAACENIEEPKPDPQPEIELQITSENPVAVAAEGGEVVITYALSTESDTLPEASCEAQWISNITVADTTITLSVAANEAEESRAAALVVTFNTKSYSVEIEQAGNQAQPQPETFRFTMATAERNSDITGNEFSIAFTTREGNTTLVAHLVGNANDATLQPETYSSATNTLILDKTTLTTKGDTIGFTEGEAVVTLNGEQYNFTFNFTDADSNKYVVLYIGTVTNMEQQPVGPETFAPVKVAAEYSMIGNFNIQLYIDDTRYHELDLLDESEPNDNYLSAGLYTTTNGTIGTKSTYCTETGNTCALEAAEITLAHNEEAGTSTVVGFIKSVDGHHITFDWTGAIEGFKFKSDEPDSPDVTEPIAVEITTAKVNYDNMGQKQILFTGPEQSHQLYFAHSDIVASKPIPDGTYSLADATMDSRYCLHDYGNTDGEMQDVVVTITNNDDKTSRFIASWTYEGYTYTFDWTGTVEGYEFEEVSDNMLDFTPIYVELSDAGYAGLYFYFYDEAENELVLNYDGGKIYMPYINYEGKKININKEEYTFEFNNLGDGTYDYNVQLVTIDGRIIAFSGPLTTDVY